MSSLSVRVLLEVARALAFLHQEHEKLGKRLLVFRDLKRRWWIELG